MAQIKPVSRWITIQYDYITEKHSLYYYADKSDIVDGKAWIAYFRWNGRKYAIDQFISRFSAWGFDKECKEYPPFICGYDADGSIYNPLLLAMDKSGDKVRLYLEV